MADYKGKNIFLVYLEYYPFLLAYSLIYILPLRLGYAICSFCVKSFIIFDPKHFWRSVQHMRHSGFAKNYWQAIKMTFRSFGEFGKLLVEVVKRDQLYTKDCFTVAGSEKTLDRILPERNPDGPRHVILITAHLGNWEVAGPAVAEIMQVPMTSLMRPFSNPKIGKLILEHRAEGMHTVISKEKGVRPLLKALLHKEIATILIDQHAAGNEGVVCEFFGHPASVHMTPALLHLKTRVPIMPELTVRTGDFKFEMRVGDLIEYEPTGDKEFDILKITQMCISALEKMIREVPEQWSWAPRHWRDINRHRAAEYKDWKPDPRLADVIYHPQEKSQDVSGK